LDVIAIHVPALRARVVDGGTSGRNYDSKHLGTMRPKLLLMTIKTKAAIAAHIGAISAKKVVVTYD
jgi:hypothetical protein